MRAEGRAMDAVSVNPVNGVEVGRYRMVEAAGVEEHLTRAAAAYRQWRVEPAHARARLLTALAGSLRRRAETLARMAVTEMGKPLLQARAEVEKCAGLCDWLAANGPDLLEDETTPVGAEAVVSWRPVGVVLGVMPWNFPYWQAMRGAAGAALGGNVYVLKPAANVMGCAELLAGCWRAACAETGAPEGVFSVLNAGNELTLQAVGDARVAAVAVTGSVGAGAAVAAAAGAAVKKCVLELGGSDALMVLADADLGRAVQAAVTGRFQYNGEICIAAKRMLVERPVAAEFTRRLVEAVRALKVGDPMAEETYLGPMARADLREELGAQVTASVEAGARVECGGRGLDGPGFYYAPTVLTGVRPGMRVWEEETFGPVACVTEVADTEEALRLANASKYGLNGSIWTRDEARGRAMAAEMECGGVFVNGIPASDARVPIGGVKQSGFGRELGVVGLREFLNAQVVWIRR